MTRRSDITVQRPEEQNRKNQPTGRDKKPAIDSHSETKTYRGTATVGSRGLCW